MPIVHAQFEAEDTETGPYTPEEFISELLLGSGVLLTNLEFKEVIQIVIFNTFGQLFFMKTLRADNEKLEIQLNKLDIGPSEIYSYHVYTSQLAESRQIVHLT